jgi:hypothetical protein
VPIELATGGPVRRAGGHQDPGEVARFHLRGCLLELAGSRHPPRRRPAAASELEHEPDQPVEELGRRRGDLVTDRPPVGVGALERLDGDPVEPGEQAGLETGLSDEPR